jgi:hypothetical protein|tara:strand:- start:2870 stop:3202 length:333 start_codon:yes stop_codon:yes gene_type:complete
MDTSKVIVEACLCEPPSEAYAFRYISVALAHDLDLDILIESPADMKDLYWFFLKKLGAYDAITDIVTQEEKEKGVRIYQNECILPIEIKIQKIVLENQISLINRVKKLTE